MKRQPSLTPTALRTRYHEVPTPHRAGRFAGPLPRRAAEADADGCDEWLAHVLAGRIAVR